MGTESKITEKLIYRSEVLEITGFSYPTLWEWMRKGTFPRSIEVGGGVAWWQSEFEEWLANLPRRRLKGDAADSSSSDEL